MNVLADIWFDWQTDGWPLVMALLVGLGCGLLGTVFLLRQAALLGDAVSHSVLPGIAGGLLVAGFLHPNGEDEVFGLSLNMLYILGGALAAGLLSTAIIEALSRYTRIKPDTALAAVFPAFFAAGVILIDVLGSDAHFDSGCIFYGSLEVIGEFHQVAPTLAATGLVTLFFVAARKEILISSFDADLARLLGLRLRLVNGLLISLLAATVVCAFEAVGAILVVAFLIIPPAAAYLFVDRFHHVLLLSAAIGMASGAVGCWLTNVLGSEAIGFETARAPTMAIVAGLFFGTAFLFAPRRGVIAQWRTRGALRRRILDENLLGALYRLARIGEGGTDAAAPATKVGLADAASALRYPMARLLPAMRREVERGEAIDHGDGTVSLTAEGTSRIQRILRGHRLWESYLASELGAAPDHVHDAADRMEHYLQPSLVDELDRLLEHPRKDPHGREIPSV